MAVEYCTPYILRLTITISKDGDREDKSGNTRTHEVNRLHCS